MATLLFNPILFCTNGTFLDSIVDILCNTNGIFTVSAKRDIKDIYTKMRSDFDKPQYVIYPLSGNVINGLNTTLLEDPTTQKIYAGHDLPVWLNDPSQSIHRLLVVSQDPRRNVDEMKNKEIGISTPFGLHSIEWRSDMSRGLIHWVVVKLFNESEFKNSLSVYYTDVYKFRGVDDKSNNIDSTLDKKNSDIYYKIFNNEIDLFNPTVILLMGDEAKEAYHRVCGDSDKDKEVVIPHPSPSANNKWSKVFNEFKTNIIFNEFKTNIKCTPDNKIEYIYERLLEKLRK